VEEVLQQILTKLTDIEATMVTKSEFNDMVGTLVTKDEFNQIVSTLVTKDEFNQIVSTLATKEELSDLRTEMREGFARVDRKLNAISEQVAYNAEQEIRISHLEAEVRIIKKTIASM